MVRMLAMFVCTLMAITLSAHAAPPTSVDDARKAFNEALKNNNTKALAELIGDGTFVLKRFGDKTRYTKAKILKSNILDEALLDPIPTEAKCRKTRCSWKEAGYCGHGDGKFKVTFKKRKQGVYLTHYTFDCK